MSALFLDEQSKQLLLTTIDGLPPVEYLPLCKTQDQRQHWRECQRDWNLLKEEIGAYFRGQPSKLPSLPKTKRRYLGTLRTLYLAWFAVVQYGWAYIEASRFKDGAPISKYRVWSLDIAIDSPITALVRVLEDDCFYEMRPAFLAYYRFTPHKIKQMNKWSKRISEGIAQPNDMRRLLYEMKQMFQPLRPYTTFGEQCITACESQAADDENLSDLIQAYHDAGEKVCKAMESMIRSREIVGFEWKNGIKSEMSSKGGVPCQ